MAQSKPLKVSRARPEESDEWEIHLPLGFDPSSKAPQEGSGLEVLKQHLGLSSSKPRTKSSTE